MYRSSYANLLFAFRRSEVGCVFEYMCSVYMCRCSSFPVVELRCDVEDQSPVVPVHGPDCGYYRIRSWWNSTLVGGD